MVVAVVSSGILKWWHLQWNISSKIWWYTSGILVVLPAVYQWNIGGIASGIPEEYWWYYQPYTSGISVVLPTIYQWIIGGIASG